MELFSRPKIGLDSIKVEDTNTKKYEGILDCLRIWSSIETEKKFKLNEVWDRISDVENLLKGGIKGPEEEEFFKQFVDYHKFILFNTSDVLYHSPIPLEELRKEHNGYKEYQKNIEILQNFQNELTNLANRIKESFYEKPPQFSDLMLQGLNSFFDASERIKEIFKIRLDSVEILLNIYHLVWKDVESILNACNFLPPLKFMPPILIYPNHPNDEAENILLGEFDKHSESIILYSRLFLRRNLNEIRAVLAHEIAHAQHLTERWNEYTKKMETIPIDYQQKRLSVRMKIDYLKNLIKSRPSISKTVWEEFTKLDQSFQKFESNLEAFSVYWKFLEGFAVLIECIYMSRISKKTYLEYVDSLQKNSKEKFNFYKNLLKNILKVDNEKDIEKIVERLNELNSFIKRIDLDIESISMRADNLIQTTKSAI